MRTLKAILSLCALTSAAALVACSDGGGNHATEQTDGGVAEPTDGGTPESPDGSTTDDGGPTASSFPAYVKSLIETKTADTTTPEPLSAWDAIPDDASAATATALFPAAFFP